MLQGLKKFEEEVSKKIHNRWDKELFLKTYKLAEMLKNGNTELTWNEKTNDGEEKYQIVVKDYEHAYTLHHVFSGLNLIDKITDKKFYFFLNCWNGQPDWFLSRGGGRALNNEQVRSLSINFFFL